MPVPSNYIKRLEHEKVALLLELSAIADELTALRAYLCSAKFQSESAGVLRGYVNTQDVLNRLPAIYSQTIPAEQVKTILSELQASI